MSQGGFDKYSYMLVEESTLIIDQDLVHSIDASKAKNFFSIPATRMAEELGRKMMANIVMLGFFTAVTDTLTVDSARNAVAGSVPKGTEKLNITAFNKGFEFGLATLKGRQKKAEAKKGASA